MARKTAKQAKGGGDVSVASNRAALHDYAIEERVEAGVALTGTEVKSLRGGRASLREGFVRVANDEAWLEGVHIPPYEHGTYANHDPTRPRKLLLHKHQIRELGQKSQAQGYTIVPIRVYFRDGRAKVEIALARGRRQYDKRQAIAERETKREIARAMRDRG
ncbi:MAG: SsrA-binding protein SmpB [Chloroflexota bacterium]